MRFVFIFLTLNSLIFACVCSGQISSSFSNFTSHITSKLGIQSQSLSVLTQNVRNNIEKLKAQNTLLKQELALLKKEALQSEKTIFLLKQKNQLE